jgi:electron transport complex protein RnfD
LGYVKWQVPVFYIGTVGLLVWALPVAVKGGDATYYVTGGGQPLFHMLAGGLFLGAFYMATDMVTSPVSRRGLVIFAVGCGLLTVAIRYYGGYPEGVCYAILLMNTATPLIDRYTKSRVFGEKTKNE